jgi:membrane fusion protein
MNLTGPQSKVVAETVRDREIEPLFRQEVLDAGAAQWLGQICLAQPLGAKLIVTAAAIIATLILALIILGDYARKTNIPGIVEPVNGSLNVPATSAGLITKIFVSEGQPVKAGEPLFRISSEHQQKQGELTFLIDQQLDARKHSLAVERRSRTMQASDKRTAITERLRYLDAEAAHLNNQIELAKERKALAESSLTKLETLQKNGFISQTQFQSKQEEILALESNLSELRRNVAQLAATRVGLLADRNDIEQSLANDLAQIDIAEASLTQEMVENRNRRESLLVAPADGIVTAVAYRLGQSVFTGQVLATVLARKNNDGGLQVQLFAPSRTVGFVAVGQPVLLRYDAFPYQKFGLHQGVISGISNSPFARSDLPPQVAGSIPSNAAVPNEPLYRINVQLARQDVNIYGHREPLKVGMTVEADVIQDRRKIWEWMLEPVLAVAKR